MGALHGYSYTYVYDAAGNRSSKTVGGTTTSYTYDSANKLTAAGVKSYSYDNAGSVTSVYNSTTGITTALTYDGESRMTSASNNPTSGAFGDTFAYNGNDQRYAKSDSTGSFGYTRQDDAIDSPVLSDGAAVYNHGADGGLVSEVRGSASKFYHSDALGSTGALTNSSGSTTDTLVTDAFGQTVTGSGSTPSPFGFVGQGGYQSDSDTGLMLLGHRYYDSSTGRFLSRDPIQDGNNWYTCCSNDPANVSDPTGLLWEIIDLYRVGLLMAQLYFNYNPPPNALLHAPPIAEEGKATVTKINPLKKATEGDGFDDPGTGDNGDDFDFEGPAGPGPTSGGSGVGGPNPPYGGRPGGGINFRPMPPSEPAPTAPVVAEPEIKIEIPIEFLP